jgi:hypothetical protein
MMQRVSCSVEVAPTSEFVDEKCVMVEGKDQDDFRGGEVNLTRAWRAAALWGKSGDSLALSFSAKWPKLLP